MEKIENISNFNSIDSKKPVFGVSSLPSDNMNEIMQQDFNKHYISLK